MPNMKSLISYGSKVIVKVKVDNRQTDKQTDKQTGQKPYAPDHSIWGHNNSSFKTVKISVILRGLYLRLV